MPSTGDRSRATAEFRHGEPIPGTVASRSVGAEARPASAAGSPDRDGLRSVVLAPTIGSPQSFCSMTVDGVSEDRPHFDVGSGEESVRSAGAICESAPLFGATERIPTIGGLEARRCVGTGRRLVPMLILWAVLIADLQGLLWLSGVKTFALQQAVEKGVARAESYAVAETGDNQIQKAIRDQRATLRFWMILALMGDFIVEPTTPAVRTLMAATLLSALAALVGRPIGYRLALDESAAAQGYWVLALALQTTLVFALGTPEIDASMALLLPAGTYRATEWVATSQFEVFAILGWIALIRGGWRRGQSNLATATAACAALAAFEAAMRIGSTVLTGAMMRSALSPGRL